MKPIAFIFCSLLGGILSPALASAQNVTEALLQQMTSASQTLSYEFSYVNVSKLGIESLQYSHSIQNGKPLVQLINMDGPQREVIMHGIEVSYFEPGIEPFSIRGDHIVDSLPSLVFADISRLEKYYDFIPVGRSRIANRICDVIRVVSRDGLRYSYIVWLDSETKLPLRADLLDRDGDTLEQFRVVAFNAGDTVKNKMADFSMPVMPPLLAMPAGDGVTMSWIADWLPQGFTESSRSRHSISGADTVVESRLYTDGLFSFSLSVAPAGYQAGEHLLRQGRRTIHTETRGNIEITVIGELPPATAKRVANSVVIR
ncbi:sigma-E factor regulatory protein RseB [Pragia fontium]|uniref:Sigma E regulatory protein, MucB/RseB n=2 Tax=Pragia fontium TaxID=82985 RepID=A0AAJ4W7B5_9GAMM|nr:sigma-E factor regulatory protein RseB [Pragia fontium]AKJ41578.1 anti-sigma E factor [Pragia fontium]SFB95205.1 sigma E regulatory protein, MucB/RseB [Pragia fontium DSM 5563 = ATCC 49100]SUB81796.1 Sigma-E factor regulatory protein rseB precursor [Pragia fontium]VEJ54344.1 Sigma-E factor regulatory protein rseB precursor [Pragia fontium]GKX63095.1 sigma-E factor regulatory protein RseB [Pragia fontium]